jgi:hypothetical protein
MNQRVDSTGVLLLLWRRKLNLKATFESSS